MPEGLRDCGPMGTMEGAPFVHLQVHSQYSLLGGAWHLERLIRKAAQASRLSRWPWR